MSNFSAFAKSVRDIISGEIYTDPLRMGIYSTDASIYQIQPLAVIFPKTDEDCEHIVRCAQEYQIPLLPRGGGTSLAGQAVGEAAVLDFTRYMHRILEINADERWIRVEPGITRDEVNTVVRKHRLEFAPDPATSSRAAIGGMIANNSSGTKSILYGKTSDHVISLKVLCADGTVLDLPPNGQVVDSQPGWDKLEAVRELVLSNTSEIMRRFPKTMRRVSGYCLDELVNQEPWQPQKLFSGSEGTLGILLEAKINLVPLPKYKSVAVVQFDPAIDAVKAVKTMLEHQPAAIEILSETVLDYSRKNLATKDKCDWIAGAPKAVQIIEFYGDTADDVLERPQRMFDALRTAGLGYAFNVYPEGRTYENIWTIRKKGLGLLLGEPADKRGIAFIEDAAIPVENLPEYIEQVLRICDKHGVDVTYYAHASVGVIHVRPILDLRQGEDIAKMKSIAREVFALVKSYGGAWSGEHGDGLVRSAFLKDYFGETVYGLFEEVKTIFDPQNIMNPGKIVNAPPMDQNLRYGKEYYDDQIDAAYRYPEQYNFHTAVHQCTGIGACRKIESGTMCPSFMVTRDDTHSTRGRANALRLAMSGQLPGEGLSDPALMETLDLCLSCKACKAECPSSVDMARLKGEVLNQQYRLHGTKLRDRLIGSSPEMARQLSGTFARLVNAVQSSGVFRQTVQRAAGFDARRTLPKYAQQTFTSWFTKNDFPQHERSVALFADTYMNYYEPELGQAAVRLIQALGWDVTLVAGCCQRPRISHGLLDDAKEKARETCDRIATNAGPVLVCEPSCATAFADDLPDLLDDSGLGRAVRQRVRPLESWIAQQLIDSNHHLKIKQPNILLHGHCHQKALFGTKDIHSILTNLGADVTEIDSGCCGMAGAFGYEKGHYEISKAIGERVLFREIERHPKALLIASGFSCRHQIEHFVGRKVSHWLEAINSR